MSKNSKKLGFASSSRPERIFKRHKSIQYRTGHDFENNDFETTDKNINNFLYSQDLLKRKHKKREQPNELSTRNVSHKSCEYSDCIKSWNLKDKNCKNFCIDHISKWIDDFINFDKYIINGKPLNQSLEMFTAGFGFKVFGKIPELSIPDNQVILYYTSDREWNLYGKDSEDITNVLYSDIKNPIEMLKKLFTYGEFYYLVKTIVLKPIYDNINSEGWIYNKPSNSITKVYYTSDK